MDPSASRDEALFTEALALPGAQRAEFLARACGGDAAAQARVAALLAAHDTMGGFLSEPLVRLPAGEVTSRGEHIPDELPGQRIGPYRLRRKLGEGGCGIVYLAEQEHPIRREVALKVIKLGMDTAEVIDRFASERQALALMDHPNIARVLDAGATEQGRPFFVMELVEGEPITRYCDEQHLSTAARLELFLAVCRAVQHAHQKGIIHRDLKPSNLLVVRRDGAAVPKVIDFGIAKATQGPLTDRTVFTAVQQFIGTPAYMSPEQADLNERDIDTRSDIYSLGVLLYELLTGRPPFDPQTLAQSGLNEMRRMIREIDPPRPSTRLSTLDAPALQAIAHRQQSDPPRLIHVLRGDLDWIVMRCLQKDRGRRYATASELAADLTRHLHHEPVNARPPSRWYALQRLVRRNRGVFAAGTTLFATLAVALAVLTAALQQKTEAVQREAAARAQADRLVVYLLNSVRPALEQTQRSDLLLRLGRETLRYYRELPADAGSVHTLAGRATAVECLGWAQAWRGQYAAAGMAFQQAVELRRRMREAAPQDVDCAAMLINDRFWAAWSTEAQRNPAIGWAGRTPTELAPMLETLIAEARSLHAVHPLHFGAAACLASLLERLAWVRLAEDGAGARRLVDEAQALLRVAYEERPADRSRTLQYSQVLRNRARLLGLVGETDAALQDSRAAHELAERLHAAEPGNVEFMEESALAAWEFSKQLSAADSDQAVPVERVARSRFQALVRIDPARTAWRRGLALTHHSEAWLLHANGAFAEARALFAQCRDLLAPFAAGEERRILASLTAEVAWLEASMGHVAAARRLMEEAVSEYEACAGDRLLDPLDRLTTALEQHERKALTLDALADWPQLELLASRWVAEAQAAVERHGESPAVQLAHARAKAALGRSRLQQGRATEATTALQEAAEEYGTIRGLATWREKMRLELAAQCSMDLAQAWLEQGELAEARRWAEAALDTIAPRLDKQPGPASYQMLAARCSLLLAEALEGEDPAAAVRREALLERAWTWVRPLAEQHRISVRDQDLWMKLQARRPPRAPE